MRLFAVLIASLLVAGAQELAITEARLHQYEDSPPVGSTYPFRAGEMVSVSFRIAGFKMDPDRRISLEYNIRASDASGMPLGAPKSGKIETELALEDKDWLPKVRYQVQLPDTPSPGRHLVELSVRDQLAGKEARATLPFQVEAPTVSPAESVTIRDFAFLRSEDAANPLPERPSYAPGSTVWARFQIAGYAFGPKNRYDVRYGLQLRDASGKVLFREPHAAAQADESFYPRRYVGATLSLNLEKNIRPGEYVLVISLTDAIAGQTIESEHPFRVE